MPHDIKSLIAMLNRPEDMNAILGWAGRLAKDFDASADAVFLKYDITGSPTMFANGFGFYASTAVIDELTEASEEAEKAAKKAFEAAAKTAPPARLGRLQILTDGLRGDLAATSRCYDLGVAHLPEGSALIADETILAEFLLQGGAPAFLAPRGTTPDAPLSTALIAWDGSLEASRALRAAMPFLKKCGSVALRAVVEKGGREVAFGGVERYLGQHGVKCDSAAIKAADGGAGDALLKEADRISADLIVMGAFGHSPWREQLFGGATHDVLRAAGRPLILAH